MNRTDTGRVRRGRARRHLAIPLAALTAMALVLPACTGDDDTEEGGPTSTEVPRLTFDYGVPLDPGSPWPKFRRTAVQDGRSPVEPVDTGRAPWTFDTGKGIFSTPVIDGDGTTYVGSADRNFYAIDRDGNERWRVATGEIIDSSALLDDRGRVYVGSGDGVLYALDRATGETVWTFEAEPAETTDAFINWFEGNVAMGPDGTLYVPNDNFRTYAVDRDTGQSRWAFTTADQTWSLPAVDPATGELYLGNNFQFADNIAALDPADGTARWTATAQGTVAASPLLTPDGLVVVGGFDGIVRALDAATGAERWTFGARDHLYASPAQATDGTIIQPSADGTVYALDPADGSLRWAYDALDPIRSSPAIDGAGNIYLGTGGGALVVLNPDGTLRWRLQLIESDRDDLNASPALGTDQIVIAGESGQVFGIPYDYCLRDALGADSGCTVGGGEGLPDDGALVLFTTRFGKVLPEPPTGIQANQPLAFSLVLREGGDTRQALIDSESLEVTIGPDTPAIVDTSGDRKFVTVVPETTWPDQGADGGDATLTVRVRGDYLVDLDRDGLRFSGGTVGGTFDETFTFDVLPASDAAPPFVAVPESPGTPASTWELYRLAAPLPTILPSYNQIGFDSIHYLIGSVGRTADGDVVTWAVEGAPTGDNGATEVDPTSAVRFPLVLRQDGQLATFVNEAGFTIEFNGFPLPFDFFRVATRFDTDGNATEPPAINAKAVCSRITFYGPFLQQLGYCNPTTDLLDVFGGAEMRPFATEPLEEGTASMELTATAGTVTATVDAPDLRADEHVWGLLLLDAETGQPLPLAYTQDTQVSAAPDGSVASVAVAVRPEDAGRRVRVLLLVDTYPAATGELTLP
ncbi:MAG: PQQ-binding-like beta-propeller repeat protein [Acidimicrobiales bacterium]|nr:PQQ-binding-like beta-propeller repeat protein [Acidimicrobiales bacterium]